MILSLSPVAFNENSKKVFFFKLNVKEAIAKNRRKAYIVNHLTLGLLKNNANFNFLYVFKFPSAIINSKLIKETENYRRT